MAVLALNIMISQHWLSVGSKVWTLNEALSNRPVASMTRCMRQWEGSLAYFSELFNMILFLRYLYLKAISHPANM